MYLSQPEAAFIERRRPCENRFQMSAVDWRGPISPFTGRRVTTTPCLERADFLATSSTDADVVLPVCSQCLGHAETNGLFERYTFARLLCPGM